MECPSRSQVTGVDLVQAQLLIASGATLASIGLPSQDAVVIRGYAIQARARRATFLFCVCFAELTSLLLRSAV